MRQKIHGDATQKERELQDAFGGGMVCLPVFYESISLRVLQRLNYIHCGLEIPKVDFTVVATPN